MSTSDKPANGSSVTKSELTAILEDYYFYCYVVGPAGSKSTLFIEWGKLECPACGVQGGMRLSEEHVRNYFLLCTCKKRRGISASLQQKTDLLFLKKKKKILTANVRVSNRQVL